MGDEAAFFAERVRELGHDRRDIESHRCERASMCACVRVCVCVCARVNPPQILMRETKEVTPIVGGHDYTSVPRQREGLPRLENSVTEAAARAQPRLGTALEYGMLRDGRRNMGRTAL